MKLDGERFFKPLMVVLLTLRADCSRFTLKPAHLSPYLPITDELFPEFTQVFKDPNGETALRYREALPTPQTIAEAPMQKLRKLRSRAYPGFEQLVLLQSLAAKSIGIKDSNRQKGLVFAQKQLIQELKLIRRNIEQINTEIDVSQIKFHLSQE